MDQAEAPETPARPERKATLRFGQHGLNVILTIVILLIALPLLFIGYHVAMGFKSKRDVTIAESNLRSLYQALYDYAIDWDGKLPPAEYWTDAITGHLPSASGIAGGKLSYLSGPGDGDTVRYVYNEDAAGYAIQDDTTRNIDPGDLVLLIERTGARPNAHVTMPVQGTSRASQGLYKLLDFPHYSDDPDNATTVILFANGTVAVKSRKDLRAP